MHCNSILFCNSYILADKDCGGHHWEKGIPGFIFSGHTPTNSGFELASLPSSLSLSLILKASDGEKKWEYMREQAY